jgi:hypothetical protein
MEKQPEQQNKIQDDYKQITIVLEVPALGKPLPDNRRWTLPLPDPKTLEDYPLELDKLDSNFVNIDVKTQVEKSKTGASYAKESPKQSGRS